MFSGRSKDREKEGLRSFEEEQACNNRIKGAGHM